MKIQRNSGDNGSRVSQTANKGGTADIRSLASENSGAGYFLFHGKACSMKQKHSAGKSILNKFQEIHSLKRRTYHGKGKEISGIHHLHE